MTGAALPHDWFPRPIPANVVIGERSWVYSSFAFLHYRSRKEPGVIIGHDTGIYNGSFFELGSNGEVEIGDYCTLVGAIISTNHKVLIQDYAFIAHEVLISDSPFAAPDMPAEEDLGTPNIVIGENAWIGARAVLLRGADIGDGAIVGAAAVVDFPVPPYAIAAGNPARIVGRVQTRTPR